jgi:acyl-CoA synthetase (NDP forming)
VADTPHRLDALLRPRSIAVLGATERAGTVGRTAVENLLKGGFDGALYAVNPRYASVCGVECFASLAALPSPVEHVILTVGDARVEAALDEVIAHGARAATVMSSLVLADDHEPLLRERVAAKVRASDLLVCGANGMGFYNFTDGIWACGFQTRSHGRDGNVAYISHSGSGMCGIVDTDERIAFNLVVSTGQELAVAMDDYLDFALDLPSTRVVGSSWRPCATRRGWYARSRRRARGGFPSSRSRSDARSSRRSSRYRTQAQSPGRMRATRRCSIVTASSASTTWTSSRPR